MGEFSGIAWTTHTFNPWIGCTKVGPGCDNCYAEVWDRRFDAEHVARHWGPGAPRRRTKPQNWSKVRHWQRDRRAAIDRGETPEPVRVFCASLADVFDNEVPREWRMDLLRLIRETPDLDWILVTKRVGNVSKMVEFADQWATLPSNVIVLATIVNQPEADRDLDKLVALKACGVVGQVGVSYEPALGPVDWRRWLDPMSGGLDWIIVGGESAQGGAEARLFSTSWARSTIAQCRAAGVAVFVKQIGTNPTGLSPLDRALLRDRAGADPDEWPEDIRVREFPVLGRAGATVAP